MSKPKTTPVANPDESGDVAHTRRVAPDPQPQKPLSGSKTVKNRNHSRHNNGEG